MANRLTGAVFGILMAKTEINYLLDAAGRYGGESSF